MFETASKEDWVVIAALASPHILYAFIWFNSDTWRRWFGKSSVEKFETAAWLLKGGWLERFGRLARRGRQYLVGATAHSALSRLQIC